MTPRDFVTPASRLAPPSLDDKRRAAIAWLGERWLLHPSNAPHRRRAPYGEPRRVRS